MGPNPQVFSQDLTWLFLFYRSYPKFFSKFDVRMNYHKSYVFSKICRILFIVGSTSSLFILPENLSNFGGVFPVISWRLKKSFPLNLVRSPEIRGVSSMLSYQIVSSHANSFHPSGAFQELLSLSIIRRPSFLEDFFIISFQIRSLIILYPCPFVHLNILPVLRSSVLYQLMIFLFFCI